MLCSDGLTNMLSDDMVEHILNESEELLRKVGKLVSRANEVGGHDNISVILIIPNKSRGEL